MSVRERLALLRDRSPWLRHLRRTGRRYVAQRGSHLASAIAFATVVAATPLLMVLFAAAGFLFRSRPDLVDDLEAWVVGAFPPVVAQAVDPLVAAVVAGRGPVLSIGTLVAVWAGTTWLAVVREALAAMWRLPPRPPVSARRVLRDLVSLLVLLAALVVSVALTVTATGGLDTVLRALGLPAQPLSTAVGVVLGWAVSWAVLAWLLGRLPGLALPLRRVAPVAAVGALLVELITIGTTLTIGATAGSLGGAVFGTLLAVFAFLYATARMLLSLAAWLATSHPLEVRQTPPRPAQPDAVQELR